MSHILLRQYPLRARLIFIALAVALLPFLGGAPVLAQHSPPPGRASKASPRLSGSRAAGAYWAEPWQQGGAKILDTRRSAPPGTQATRPSAVGSLRSPNLSHRTTFRPGLAADPYARGTWTRGFQEFFGTGQIFPFTPFGFRPLGTRSLRLNFPVGRGRISVGRGFGVRRPGFHGRGFRGRGFRGGGFRGR